MLKETTIFIGNEKTEVLMQSGFFNLSSQPSGIHKHQYSEAHIVAYGEVEFFFSGESHVVGAGDMIVIPENVMHYSAILTEDAQKISFQITKSIDSFYLTHLGKSISDLFCAEIEEYNRSGCAIRLLPLISLAVSSIYREPESPLAEISDRGFIINEFFGENYNKDASLSELASILNVSEKQATRLVKKYTGKTFRDEITARRMEAAKYFMTEQGMSLEDVAERVGYKTYSGFWKAFNKGSV